jgi:hypothetical protein
VDGRTTLTRHPLAVVGVLLTTVSAVVFITLVAALFAGLFESPYAGLLIFVAVPAFFVLGLLLIPLGAWLERRSIRRDPAAERGWPVIDFGSQRTRRVTLLITALTAVNLVIVSIAAGGAVHTMDTPGFCGQTCHEPMEPEFVAWQASPHAHVKCTACHVGEGARALVRSKLAGVRQLYHVIIGEIPRPIHGANMRAALETCGNCHSPGRNHGEPITVKREYADNEENTETTSVLQMMVAGPGRKASTGRAIHWHADPNVRIEFVATDAERQTIPYVRMVNADGTVKEFKAEGTTDEQIARGERRVMDCIDCHNTPGHRISPTAEQAVDAAIAAGDVNRELPFIRREGVRVVKGEYPTAEQALTAIEKELRDFYAGKWSVDQRDLARSIASIQRVYRQNVFPSMKVTFGTYPSNIGHITSNGCFRCHDGGHTAGDGTAINGDCEYCHVQKE